ncbi:diadenosine 5'5'''-P1,P4-tetraphosphate pyrophosphohydrolase [Duganella rhizosphaerae]|uniref:NUDIX domain-containing protein n=1 Tax=Duganella rhizosphaerae TaxID=2885763 RepID=UPI0030E7567B
MKQRLLSAGMVIRRRDASGCRFLLLRCYRNWEFPKGLVEPGEDPWSAARREVLEETALNELSFPWGRAFHETPPYGQGKVARYYLALAHSDVVHLPVNRQLGRAEHHAFRWLSYDDARKLLPSRLQTVLDWAHAMGPS